MNQKVAHTREAVLAPLRLTFGYAMLSQRERDDFDRLIRSEAANPQMLEIDGGFGAFVYGTERNRATAARRLAKYRLAGLLGDNTKRRGTYDPLTRKIVNSGVGTIPIRTPSASLLRSESPESVANETPGETPETRTTEAPEAEQVRLRESKEWDSGSATPEPTRARAKEGHYLIDKEWPYKGHDSTYKDDESSALSPDSPGNEGSECASLDACAPLDAPHPHH